MLLTHRFTHLYDKSFQGRNVWGLGNAPKRIYFAPLHANFRNLLRLIIIAYYCFAIM